MSVLVKNVKMPKTCFQCFAREWYDFGTDNHGYLCRCLHTSKCVSNCEARTKRRDDCPLVPVPAANGRLIDADALINNLEFTQKNCTITGHTAQRYREIIVELCVAPTIIPANKEEPNE